MNRRWLYFLLFCSVLLSFSSTPTLAQDNAVTWEITPGFDGAFKAGAWFPVAITVSNNGPDIRGTIAVELETNQASTYSQTIELPNNARKRVILPVASDNDSAGNVRARITLYNGSSVVRSERVLLNELNNFAGVVGIISDQNGVLPELSNIRNQQQPVTLLRLTSAALPERSELLQTFNVVFVHAVDTTTWTDAQRQALRIWVANGGQLIISGDAGVVRGLGDLLPATWEESGATANLQALGQGTGLRFRADAAPVSVLSLTPQANATAVYTSDSGQPLLVRAAMGLGVVQLAAFSLDTLANVAENPATLWQTGLRPFVDLPSATLELRSRGFWTLQRAFTLPALRLPSIIGFLGFLLIYIVVVGPLNYVVLRRFDRREWAYITVPVLVLIFSGGAYIWGTLGRGGATVLNELSLVRVLDNGRQGQATTYFTLFSPSRRSYDLSVPADGFLSDLQPGWERQGRSLNIVFAEDRVRVPEMLVDVGGTRALVAEHVVDVPQVEATINGDQVRIRNRTDQPLVDLALVRSNGQAQPLDELGPGEERTVVFNPQDFVQNLPVSTDGTFDHQAVLSELGDPLLGSSLTAPMPPPIDGPADENGADLQPAPQQQIYLFGWQSRATLPVTLDGSPLTGAGDTLYIWSVQEER